MIRATASAAAPRLTVHRATARRPLLLTTLLLTMLALVGTSAVGQRAAAYEDWDDDEIWVNADGVTFEGGRRSDVVTYVVEPAGSDGERSFSRELTWDEQDAGWAGFWEARSAYPDGYCVVWVEVDDASTWRATGRSTACTVAGSTTPTPTPTPTKKDKDPAPRVTPTRGQPEPAEPAEPTEQAAPTPVPTPTPSPSPTPSSTPSRTASSTPTPSPSHTSPQAALMQNLREQPAVRTRHDAAAAEEEIISPLGWVAVLGGGGLLTAGGALLLWRRLT